jgi:DNA topoisomerase VI subunit A
MATNNIKQSPTLNGYSANEEIDALTLIKIIYKPGLLKTNFKKKKIGGVTIKFENETKQMCEILRLLFIKEPKNLTFTKRQLYYFSKNLHLFKNGYS